MCCVLLHIVASIGILLSLYALSIERNVQRKEYRALCDINDNISCTKAIASKEGRTFGWHNATYGLCFYLLVIVFSFIAPALIFPLALLSVIYSVYLAYVTYIKQRNFCLVCTASYLVNFTILVLS